MEEPEASPRRLVVPLTHPAAIVRGQWDKEPAQEVYIKRTIARDYPVIDVSVPPPRSKLFPSLGDLEKFRSELTDAVSIDLETCGDHIICAGLTALDMGTWTVGSSVCLRFRIKGGSLYWRWPDHVKATEWLGGVLEDPTLTKLFWNGVTFDVPLLLKAGFDVEGRLVDGMTMMRTAYLEMSSSLQYTATFMLGMPVWKTLIDEEEEDK
jgi:hypothetical protein